MADELAPPWQRRAVAAPGVVDTSATLRRHERTAGWALQRMARAKEVLARYASSDGRGMNEELPLARLPVVAAAVVESAADGGSLPSASSHADGSPAAAESAPVVASVAAPSPLAMTTLARLQRRVDQPGVLSARSLAQSHPATGVAMRAELTERLSARAAAVPDARAPALLLARRLDSVPQNDGDGRDDPATSPAASTPSIPTQHVATVEHTVQRTAATAMQTGATGPTSTDDERTTALPFLPRVRATPVGSSSSSTATMLALSRAPLPESRAANATAAGASSITARMTPAASGPTSAPLSASAAVSTATGADHEAGPATAPYATSQSMSMLHATLASILPSTASPPATALPLATTVQRSDEPGVSTTTQIDRALTLHATSAPASASIARRRDTVGLRPDSSAAPSLTMRAPHSVATSVASEPSARIAREITGAPSGESPVPPSLANANVAQRSVAPAMHTDAPTAPSLTLHTQPSYAAERVNATRETTVTGASPSVAATPAVLARKTAGVGATLPRVREAMPVVGHSAAAHVLSLSRTPHAASSNGTNAIDPGPPSSELIGPLATRGAMPAVPSALIWRSSQAATPAGDGVRSRGEEPRAVMRRAVDAEGVTAASPATQTMSTTAASPPTVAAPASPDVHALAEQVMRLITRRLEIERDRRGGKRWR